MHRLRYRPLEKSIRLIAGTLGLPQWVNPPPNSGLWVRTEWHAREDDDEEEESEDRWHSKWCALLQFEDLEELRREYALEWVGSDTMGSVGAPLPGSPFGGWSWSPAVGLRADADDGFYCSVYVTPFGPDEITHSWQSAQDMRKWFLEAFDL